MPNRADRLAQMRDSYPFWTLVALLAAAFILGGSSREDAWTLVALRPIAAVCFAIGLFGLTRAEVSRFRSLLIGGGLTALLLALHLVPLPPSIWMELPGRQILADAATVAGIEQPWRPLTMVPWRGWNSFYALLVPAAALILAIRCTSHQRARLPIVLLALVLVSVLFAILQALGGATNSVNVFDHTQAGTVTGLFANRNHFALLLAISFVLLAFVAGNGPTSRGAQIRVWLLAAAATAAMPLLLLTGSRSGLVLSVLALAATPLVVRYGPVVQRGLLGRRAVLIAAAIGALLLVCVIALYFSRAATIDRLLATNLDDELRMDVWGDIVSLIGVYFPVGSGIGSFVDVYRIHEPIDVLRSSYLNHAHNDWIEWLMETGLPGLLILVAAVGGWGWRALRLIRAKPEQGDAIRLGRAGAVAILLLGLGSLVDYPGRTPVLACIAVIAAVWMAQAAIGGNAQAGRQD